MCFLLTGAVPLAGRLNAAGVPERTLPRGSQIPRTLRKILAQMLEVDREKRPHDPVLLAGGMRQSLVKLEKRNGSGQRVSAPVQLPAQVRTERRVFSSPLKALAIAASVLLLAALAAGFFPRQVGNLVHRQRPIAALGVPVGVPETHPATKIPPIGFTRDDNSGWPAPSAAEVASLSQRPATTLASRLRAGTSPVENGKRDLAIAKSTAIRQHPVQPNPPPAAVEREVRRAAAVAPRKRSPEPSERTAEVAADDRASEPSVAKHGANDPVETMSAASTLPHATTPEATNGAAESPFTSAPPDVVPETSPALITRDESSPAPAPSPAEPTPASVWRLRRKPLVLPPWIRRRRLRLLRLKRRLRWWHNSRRAPPVVLAIRVFGGGPRRITAERRRQMSRIHRPRRCHHLKRQHESRLPQRLPAPKAKPKLRESLAKNLIGPSRLCGSGRRGRNLSAPMRRATGSCVCPQGKRS